MTNGEIRNRIDTATRALESVPLRIGMAHKAYLLLKEARAELNPPVITQECRERAIATLQLGELFVPNNAPHVQLASEALRHTLQCTDLAISALIDGWEPGATEFQITTAQDEGHA